MHFIKHTLLIQYVKHDIPGLKVKNTSICLKSINQVMDQIPVRLIMLHKYSMYKNNLILGKYSDQTKIEKVVKHIVLKAMKISFYRFLSTLINLNLHLFFTVPF